MSDPQKVIAVDVDGTLYRQGKLNERLVCLLRERKAEGYSLMLWSMRGAEYARQAAELYGVAGLFDVICSKPGYIIDDAGWSWIKFTKRIR